MRRGEFIAGLGSARDSTGLVRVRLQYMKGIVTPALVTAVLALSACASYPPASPPPLPQIFAPDQVLTESVKAERKVVSKAYSSCLARAVKRLDDYNLTPRPSHEG